ncbi:MAG: dTDP-4-dehydrorhamnose 3,5-epimerase [Verrucomicrobia bacterium]|nr:dTDP-4-dehydrorhamnose 3,5-epimerase [Verrucomicrobiota bacterium]
MKFHPATLPGLWRIELEPRSDERGFLARTYCEQEFAVRGLNTRWPQANMTLTRQRGFIRGLHFQADPYPETKLIRCSSGAIYDVLVDLRPDSPAFGRWEAFELSAASLCQLYVPAGLAHGFQCLTDSCEVQYLMSEFYHPESARGVRWNDPALQIPWPIPGPFLSERDRQWPLLSELA